MDNPTDHDFRPMPHNPQFCTFFGCMKNQSQHADAVDRGSLSLGQLDGHGLARLREIVLETIDAGDPADKQPWALYEHDDSNGPEWTEADANEQRLRFADQIARRIAEDAK